MQGQLMLDLTGGKYGPWIVTDKGDQTVRSLMDEHYSRQTIGARQFCRPGHNLVLRTADGSAAWISWRGIRDDGIEDAWECTAFRNTSGKVSSDLIHWAVYATICEWGHVFPAAGMITYVDGKKVSSEVPGYCFIRAGFKKKGVSKHRKLLLFHLPITKNYLAKRAIETINCCQTQINLALESGEFYEAVWFQQYAQRRFEWVSQLQSMIHAGEMSAWKDYVPHMDLSELEELISPYEGLGEVIEEMEPAWGY
jgi:hypothetical protein